MKAREKRKLEKYLKGPELRDHRDRMWLPEVF
jgi:hypothetical protein